MHRPHSVPVFSFSQHHHTSDVVSFWNQSHKTWPCLQCSAPPLSCSPSTPTALKLSASAAVPPGQNPAYETSQQVTQPDNCRLDSPRGLSCCHTVSKTLSNWWPFYSCLNNYCLSFAKCEELHMKEDNTLKPATDVCAQAAWLRQVSEVATALVLWCLGRDLWDFDINSLSAKKTCMLSLKEMYQLADEAFCAFS